MATKVDAQENHPPVETTTEPTQPTPYTDDETARQRAAFLSKISATDVVREAARSELTAHLRRLEEVSASVSETTTIAAAAADSITNNTTSTNTREEKKEEDSQPVQEEKEAPAPTAAAPSPSPPPEQTPSPPPSPPQQQPNDQSIAILRHYGASDGLLAAVAEDTAEDTADALTEEEALWLAHAEQLLGLQGSTALLSAPPEMDYYPDDGDNDAPPPPPPPPQQQDLPKSAIETHHDTIAELRTHVDAFMLAHEQSSSTTARDDDVAQISPEQEAAEEAELAELGEKGMMAAFHSLVSVFTANARDERDRLFHVDAAAADDGVEAASGKSTKKKNGAELATSKKPSVWDDPEVQKGLRKIARLDKKLRELEGKDDPANSDSLSSTLNAGGGHTSRVAAWSEALRKRQAREARMRRALEGDETAQSRASAAGVKSRLTEEEEVLVERLLAQPAPAEEIILDDATNPFACTTADTADVDARLAELARDHVAYERLEKATGASPSSGRPGTSAGSVAASAISTASTTTASSLDQARLAREARELKRRDAELDARLRRLKTTGDADGGASSTPASGQARAPPEEVRALAQKLLSELGSAEVVLTS